ncbi:TlpA disulfide reductase family protein [Candidatus Venteria ishoeyi]|uniref:Thiol-disulfide oxidoreductase ResA n=1 Tax=Candidatus Venteria ishoeyi TaxID=1899563 RepID=A0A1H6F2F9_9GAMM|nr:TlpA disulfide reductase family protein [Candidatus Venteria ishoeyi]SEH04348.1 Thiol-disulfide oxidoreductase ResA [Candidatus Venteria ishoeyi]
MRLLIILFLSCWFASCYVKAAEEHAVTLSDESEIILHQYPAANSEYRLLWVANAFGFRDSHHHVADLLAKAGFDVWLTDLQESLFMTRSVHHMRTLSGHYVAELLEHLQQGSDKTLILLGTHSAAMPILHGAHTWQLKLGDSRAVGGIVLFSPSLYLKVPQLGEDAQYLPVLSLNRLPIFIFQAEGDGNRWHLANLLETLHAGGSSVYAELMPNIRSLFPFDDSPPSATAQIMQQSLPDKLKARLPLLRNTALAPIRKTSLKLPELNTDSGVDQHLKPYHGKIQPTPIVLPDVNGKHYALNDYLGRVTVVNFWASWCPPCVEEIPSLNRLREKMHDTPFSLISVNYAEKPETIQKFMQQVVVDFPVLMDEEGHVSAQWKVFAYPSTFIIDPQGKIAYGVNAGIEWDTPEVLSTLHGLLRNAQ